MAEYIDREKLIVNLIESACHHVNNSREESLLYRDRNIVREQPTADVVEREKYERLDEEANALSKAYQEEHEKYKQLKLNVAKAREEITKQFVDLQDGSEEWRSYVNKTVLECVEILNKLIVESEE